MRHLIYFVIFTTAVLYGSALSGTLDLNKNVSLQFDNQPVGTVLNLIAQQYQINIVQSGDMDKRISVKLDNVNLNDALRAILSSNGYNYYFEGDVVVVKPIESDAEGETVSQVLTLNYIAPGAALNAASDMLSAKGKIKIIEDPATAGKSIAGIPRSSQLVIMDMPDVVERVAAFIKSIDLPQKQIAIEVKMVEVNVTAEKRTGFSWPTSLAARVGGLQPDVSSSTSTTFTTQPNALGQIQLPDGQWQWGKLSVDEVKVVMEYLEKSGNSKLISNPRITTLDNCEAEIRVSTVVPIQTINRFSEAGATQDIVTFQDEDIGISLLVTPHIVDGGQILLDVLPIVSEIIGYVGTEENQKPIRTERYVRTKIAVGNGETAVLGGLLKENKIEDEQKIFLLGSLPIIGNLFRHKNVQNSTTDLMIMITPALVVEK